MIPALLVANAVNAVEIYNNSDNELDLYGEVDGLHYFSDDTSEDGDQTYARFDIEDETQIASELIGYGRWEYSIQTDTAEKEGANSWTRLAFAGLKSTDYGSLDYGRDYGVVHDIESRTDMLPEFGGDTYTQTDIYITGRTNGMTTCRNSDFFGLVDDLHFTLQYQGNNENAGSDGGTNNGSKHKLARENGDGFGISSYYDPDMRIGVGAAYLSSNRTHNQLAEARSSQRYANGDRTDAWTVSARYDAGNIYLAAIYAETRSVTSYSNDSFDGIANKAQNFEVVAQYQFDDFNLPLRPSVAYLQSGSKDLYTYSHHGDKDLVKYVDVGMTYYSSKNMSTHVGYKVDLLDENGRFCRDDGIATDGIVALGLICQF